MTYRIRIAALIAAASVAAIGWAGPAQAGKGDPIVLKIDGPHADHRACVTQAEWGRIDFPAKTKRDLVTLLDGPGTKQTGNLAGVWYPICGMSSDKGRVIVTYKDGAHLNLAFWMVFRGQGSGFSRTNHRIVG